MRFSAFSKLAKLFMALALIAVPLTAAQAQIAPAGTNIVNIASATYYHTGLGLTETVRSNPVRALVLEVPAVDINGQSELFLSRGAMSEHHFRVTNTGNTPLLINATINTALENDMLTRGTVFLDLNGDGAISPNDPELILSNIAPATSRAAPVSDFELSIGESITLIYSFLVSTEAQLGEIAQSNLVITATSLSGASVEPTGTTLGVVTIVSGGLEITKSAERREIDGGDELSYQIALQNNSEQDAFAYDNIEGASIKVDGGNRNGILVRDTIPLNTVFSEFGPTGSMQPLYHLYGSPVQTYVTTPPADLSQVDAVAFFHAGDYPIGKSTFLNFSVLVSSAMGSVEVRNTAQTYFTGQTDLQQVLSNEVITVRDAELDLFLNFVEPATLNDLPSSELDRDARLQLTSGACNVSGAVDTVLITVSSVITGDMETVLATETGPNSGVFLTGILPVTFMHSPVSEDGVIASNTGDTLLASAECNGIAAFDELVIAPGGFVFHSLTNDPVRDAIVQLINEAGTILATATTDERGYYAIGDAPAGRYRLNVLPPAGLSFASKKKAFTGFNRNAQTRKSFGDFFDHAGGVVSLIDIPLDPFYGIPLALEKSANKARIQSGEFVTYTMLAHNNMAQGLMNAEITDRFPKGAVLVGDTVLIDGVPAPDPVRSEEGDHIFQIGAIEPFGQRELQYVLRFTPVARSGKRYNYAVLTGLQAGTGATRTSGIAEAMVRLNTEGGVFSREGTIIGSVFLDCNENGIRDAAEEIGVPGVQIVTQEGLMVVTDEAGKYSLFGLRPVSHVLALQPATLPEGAEPMLSRAADMLAPMSRLVPLKRGELRAEDFPLQGCTPSILAETKARAAKIADRDDTDANLLGDLPIDQSNADTRSVRTEAGLPTGTQILRGADLETPEGDVVKTAGLVEAAVDRAAATAPLEDLVRGFDSELGFLNLQNNTLLKRRSLTVRVKSPADLTMELFLNGTVVSGSRIGERVSWAGGNVQAMEFVALRLNAGKNKLKLVGKDPFGNIRKFSEITVIAPGDADRIDIVAPSEAIAAPGTVVPVLVRILDRSGVPVQTATTVTLDARVARWDVTDIRTDQPGIQAFIDNGEATFDLLAPQITGTDTITVRSGFGTATTEIRFSPDLNQRVMVGIIEGSVSLNDAGDVIETDQLSPFEDTATGLRGEVYLRGRIRGDRLLTLRYSSDRDTDDRLFRDIRADEYYPIYGDNSERGFDAQSSTNLYVKVEKGASYALYGDIAIEPTDPAFQLGGYRDVTTGAKVHWEGDNVRITAFAARTAQQSKVVEIPGRGISGPYDIDLTDFREGSERVTLITRDRDTGEVIEEQDLRRLTDYLFDFFRNAVVFDVPVPQSDAVGNRIFIRIQYQTEEENAEKYWLYGGEAVFDINEATIAGVRAIHSDGPRETDRRFRIYAGFLKTRLSYNETIEVEVAHAEDGYGHTGMAGRLAYEWVGTDAKLRFEATVADEAFAPLGSNVRAGATDLSLDYQVQLDAERALTLAAEYIEDRVADTETVSATVGIRRIVDERTTTHTAAKLVYDLTAEDRSPDLVLLRSAAWRPEAHEGLKFAFDIELPTSKDVAGLLRIGAEYTAPSGLVIYGDFELTFGQTITEFRTAHLGIDYRLNDWLEGRSEIHSDNISGNHRLIQGFSAQMELNERVALRFGLEHSWAFGDSGSSLTSLTLGGNWASKDGLWIAEGSIDQTFESTGNTLYTDFGIAGEVRPDLTLMARSRLALDRRGEGATNSRHRLRVGAAYRPTDTARLNVLAWYEHRLEKKDQREEDHIWSVAATYDLSPRVKLNGKYAGQFTNYQATSASPQVNGLMQMVQAGATWEVIPDRFEASLNAYHMWDGSEYATQAIGVEAGYVIDENMMLSLGYNMAGDRYPGNFSHYQDGFYVRLRIKLDNSVWSKLDNLMGM